MDAKKEKNAQKEMSFSDHLQELRYRLFKSLIAIVLCSITCYFFWREILSIFTNYPLSKTPDSPDLIYIGPTEAFMVSIKIAISGGIMGAIPVILYQAWRFTAPGLFATEKRYIFPIVFFSTLSFLTGAAFAYFLVIPLAFRFLMGFNTEKLMAMLSINAYIGFILKIIIAFGVVFELPIFSFILSKAGILTHTFLIKKFKYAVVVMFIVAAIITPPDVLTQFMMAIPLLLLYGISIIIALLAGKKND